VLRRTNGRVEVKVGDLAGLGFNYEPVGRTRDGEFPPGFHRLRYETRLGGEEAFAKAAEGLMTWRMQRGLRIQASTPRVAPGTDSLGRMGPLVVPCRVVWTVEEPDRIGFAYGTLSGHPEAGEESFLVTRRDGASFFTVTAYSRPATWFARLGGPLTRVAQHAFVRWYARTLRRLT
jgi:uncharacterized protein (UPF0548 family)